MTSVSCTVNNNDYNEVAFYVQVYKWYTNTYYQACVYTVCTTTHENKNTSSVYTHQDMKIGYIL